MLKNLYIFFLILILIFCSGHSDLVADISIASYQHNTRELEKIFKSSLPVKEGIVYTKVPRGLILSIDEKYFFNPGDVRLKESSLKILDTIILLLHKIPNYCIVEDHTENAILEGGQFQENWELSMARSDNIVQYMSYYGKIPAEQLFSLGFGEYMPFKDNVAPQKGMNNRIDFVIIEYDSKR